MSSVGFSIGSVEESVVSSVSVPVSSHLSPQPKKAALNNSEVNSRIVSPYVYVAHTYFTSLR